VNPGVTEETGSTARQLITSLSSTPVILALVVFNLFYIAASEYREIKQAERFAESQKLWQDMVFKAMAYCPSAEYRKTSPGANHGDTKPESN
jgi:hypothetical protein